MTETRQVQILSGISGSGKSTFAKNLQAFCHVQNPTFSVVVSADDFFMGLNGYKFDASRLSDAHAYCFREFFRAMQEDHIFHHTDGEVVHLPNNLVIVDNTNTTVEEIAPYVLGAAAFGYKCEIVTVSVSNNDDLQKCIDRNAHKVPAKSIIAQQNRILARKLPPYWNARTVAARF